MRAPCVLTAPCWFCYEFACNGVTTTGCGHSANALLLPSSRGITNGGALNAELDDSHLSSPVMNPFQASESFAREFLVVNARALHFQNGDSPP